MVKGTGKEEGDHTLVVVSEPRENREKGDK